MTPAQGPMLMICGLAGLSIFLACLAASRILRYLRQVYRRRMPAPGSSEKQDPSLAKLPKSTLKRLYRQAGFQGPVTKLYGLIALGAVLLYTGVEALLHLPPMLAAALTAAIAFLLPPAFLKQRVGKRQRQLLEQFPNALELMANALRAGLGVNSAFGISAQEIPNPLGAELSQLVAELNLGVNLEQALEHLIERTKSNDIRLLAQALILHKQVGGNLAEILDNLDHTIRERFYLEREIHSLTAEQRLTAGVLVCLPLFVGAGIVALNYAYISTLWTTKPGLYLLGFALTLQTVGILALQRILRIEF